MCCVLGKTNEEMLSRGQKIVKLVEKIEEGLPSKTRYHQPRFNKSELFQCEKENESAKDPYNFTESDDDISSITKYLSPSNSSEAGTDKLERDKNIIKEFKQNATSEPLGQNENACGFYEYSPELFRGFCEPTSRPNSNCEENNNIPPKLSDSENEISPHLPLQEKVYFYLQTLPSSFQNNSIEDDLNNNNKIGDISNGDHLEINTKDLEHQHYFTNDVSNDIQVSEKSNSFDEYLSSGTEYAPSSNDQEDSEYAPSSNGHKDLNNDHEDSNPISNSKNGDQILSGSTQIKDFDDQILSRSTQVKDLCPFCYIEVGHFSRHLIRNHSDVETVKRISQMPSKSNDRRSAIILLRRKGNFILQQEKNIIKPVRKPPLWELHSEKNVEKENYSTCVNCLGVIKNTYLWRHRKICKSNGEKLVQKTSRSNYRSESQTFLVSTGLLGNFLNKSRLLEVFKIMRADPVGLAAKSDYLICLYGESLLGKHKRQQIYVTISQKMREIAKIKLALQKSTTILNLMDALKPEMYEHFIAATKIVSGYDAHHLSFRAPSLARNMGTNLKLVCDVAKKALITKNPLFGDLENPIEKRQQINDLHNMLASHWCNDVSSLANKVLNENNWNKPKLLPLTEDVHTFNKYTSTLADEAYVKLINNEDITENYQTLAKCTLALVLLFNRKRIGEIQFLQIKTYEQTFALTNQEEMLACLSEFEKTMSHSFKRVVVSGKGSKPVPILFTKRMQKFTDLLIKIRKMTDIVPKSNRYVFANPGSDRWMAGSSVIRKLAYDCGAKLPELLTGTKFRKQIATVLQIMNIEKDEMHQIAKFMGHTEKTHMEFYRLTEDLYQTAKVAKVLLLLDAGKGSEFKGKKLSEIEILEDECHENESEIEVENEDENEVANEAEMCNEESRIQRTNPFNDTTEASCSKEYSRGSYLKNSSRITARMRWLPTHKKLVLSYFKTNIKNSVAPRKQECLKLIRKYPDFFVETDWVRIKTLVYNSYRNK